MNKRSKVYFQVRRLVKLASTLMECIEFPHFGANYPDARCIDGFLWDLDSCGEDVNSFSVGGDHPCPVCNTKAYVRDMIENGVPMCRIFGHLKFIFGRYGTYRKSPLEPIMKTIDNIMAGEEARNKIKRR